MVFHRLLLICAVAAVIGTGAIAAAGETVLNGQRFTLLDGFTIELAAETPLVERPVCVDFDEEGNLYVLDSSGSNENVQVQQETRPHRLLRLSDTDRDGRFDTRVVYATGLPYSQGATWHDGSLYVAGPPEILKFTDDNGDGQADRREVVYDGLTLTGCGNDLHGPYFGPDGWMYWGKGGAGEQTHGRPEKAPLVSRAAHVFRRKIDGGPVESVMTGGMQNIVGLTFTAGGERIYSGTFITNPQDGRRDGLTHAIYGGVYGPQNGRLDGHARTGPLMPLLDELGAAAPCGITRLETSQPGDDERETLLTCLFNMRKVTRHRLDVRGATFASETDDFLVSDNRDFHPTDVIEDADGSLLVVDTGGWYKLCCPTSQLSKPDILGAIYRIRQMDAPATADPRGQALPWNTLSAEALCGLLGDPRPVVRRRARRHMVERGANSIDALRNVLTTSKQPSQRLESIWTLTSIDDPHARAAVRQALMDSDDRVRQAAVHSASVWKDAASVPSLLNLLQGESWANARAAAEALGRIGSAEVVPQLFARLDRKVDRVLEHSLLYAVMEINSEQAVRPFLQDERSAVRCGALVALDQMETRAITPGEVQAALESPEKQIRDAGWWVVEQHLDWADDLVPAFRSLAMATPPDSESMKAVGSRLTKFAGQPAIQTLMADLVSDSNVPQQTRRVVIRAMADGRPKKIPEQWVRHLVPELESREEEWLAAVLAVIRPEPKSMMDGQLAGPLSKIGSDQSLSPRVRLQALSFIPRNMAELTPAILSLVTGHLSPEHPGDLRSLALDVLEKSRLSDTQVVEVLETIPHAGPMELKRLIPIVMEAADERRGRLLVDRLATAPALTSLQPEFLRQQLKNKIAALETATEELIARIEAASGPQLAVLEAALKRVPMADPRRGQAVFTSTRGLCSACHSVGFIGAKVGPDLTRIGRIRSERDLLESILFPSASFVRGFEPTIVATQDAHIYSGVIKEESLQELTLQLDAQKTIRVRIDEIDARKPGSVSMMPAGLEKLLTQEELADLVAFLMSSS